MGERERILSSRRYKLDHEPFDWAKEYMELMDDAWEEARRYITAEQQETEDDRVTEVGKDAE